AHPHFLAERTLHGLRERAPGTRKRPQRTRENSIELQHRTLVKNHGVEAIGLEAGAFETPLNRRQGKGRIAFPSRQALLLNGAHPLSHRRRAPPRSRNSGLRSRGFSFQYCLVSESWR